MASLINNTVASYIRSSFNSRRQDNYWVPTDDTLNMSCDISSNHCKIPLFMAVRINEGTLSNKIKCLKLGVKIINNKDQYFLNTTTKIMHVLLKGDIPNLFKTVIEGKEYYIARGLLLDSKFNPLLLLCLDCDKSETDDRFKFINTTPTLIFSEKVLEDTESNICKYIIRKLVPYILQNKPLSYVYHGECFTFPCGPIPIKVEMGTDTITFSKPNKVKADFVNEQGNQILINNINNLLIK